VRPAISLLTNKITHIILYFKLNNNNNNNMMLILSKSMEKNKRNI